MTPLSLEDFPEHLREPIRLILCPPRRPEPRFIPTEKALARWPHTPAVADRIRRRNPHGIEEGFIPNGWHPHSRIDRHMMDVMPVREFISRFGRARYNEIPRGRLIRQGHRKVVSLEYVEELTWTSSE